MMMMNESRPRRMSKEDREVMAINTVVQGFPTIIRYSSQGSQLTRERPYRFFYVSAWNVWTRYDSDEHLGLEIHEELLDQFVDKVRRLTMLELSESSYPPRDRAKYEWCVKITDIRQEDRCLRQQFGFGETELEARTMALWGASWWISQRDEEFFKRQAQDLLALKSDSLSYVERIIKFDSECNCRRFASME